MLEALACGRCCRSSLATRSSDRARSEASSLAAASSSSPRSCWHLRLSSAATWALHRGPPEAPAAPGATAAGGAADACCSCSAPTACGSMATVTPLVSGFGGACIACLLACRVQTQRMMSHTAMWLGPVLGRVMHINISTGRLGTSCVPWPRHTIVTQPVPTPSCHIQTPSLVCHMCWYRHRHSRFPGLPVRMSGPPCPCCLSAVPVSHSLPAATALASDAWINDMGVGSASKACRSLDLAAGTTQSGNCTAHALDYRSCNKVAVWYLPPHLVSKHPFMPQLLLQALDQLCQFLHGSTLRDFNSWQSFKIDVLARVRQNEEKASISRPSFRTVQFRRPTRRAYII
jgi:hypothetical protein